MTMRPAARTFSHLALTSAARAGRVHRPLAAFAPLHRQVPSNIRQTISIQQTRLLSTSNDGGKPFDFEAIKKLSDAPQKSVQLVDVREPHEVAEGYIPGAINVPIGTQPDALLLPADEFEDRFGFAKPTADTEVVFYCKAGVRSMAAAKLAQQAGWQKVGNYAGSWLDWVKNGGRIERP